jgi:hypothetical protein
MDSQPSDSSPLSSYFRELAETSKPVVQSSTLPAELRRVCGPWVSITAAVAKASFALAGVKAARPVVDLVLALSDAGDAQTELLKSIKADTLLLRQEPLQTAITLMGEAERVGPSDERWAQFLKDAVASLYRAKSLAASSEEQAVVYFGLACAYLTLDKSMDARHWIEEGVKSEREILDAFLQKQTMIVDGRHWTSLFLGAPDLTIAKPKGPASIILRTTGIQKRTENFGRFLPFANSVEICAATISSRPEVKVLVLDPRGVPQDGHYRLRQNTVTLPVRKLPDT